MTQNTSYAVMNQRQSPAEGLDDFPTPPWATRALLEHVIPRRCENESVWEPACNRGFMVRPLKEYFTRVHASDIHDYSAEFAGQDRVVDFLAMDSEPPHIAGGGVDWIITNPPFIHCAAFIERALKIAPWSGVAMLARLSILEGVDRYRRIFEKHPPAIVAPFVERVPMFKGRISKTGSTATAYCWLVWETGHFGRSEVRWIPPCRKSLERAGDYEMEKQ